MSITDELRRVAANTEEANGRCGKLYRGDLDRIADRIDEAHKHAIAYVDDRDQETMAEHGWIRLPLDADGELIFDGDKMVTPRGAVFIVAHMILENGTWTVHGWKPSLLHHYTPPTVEDVLREFSCVLLGKQEFDGDVTEAIAEYAAKLRLAGDGE